MEIICLASSSNGNAWVIKSDNQILLLDCGISIADYQHSKAIDSWQNVVGCLITHGTNNAKLEHLDHSRSFYDLQNIGINCYGTHNLKDNEIIEFGSWRVLPIVLNHSIDCFGYIIENTLENKKIIYLTDCYDLPQIMDCDYSIFLIECNWDKDTVNNNIKNGVLMQRDENGFALDYVENTEFVEKGNEGYIWHLSLEQVSEWLSTFKIKPKTIVTAHLSNRGNLDKNKIVPVLHPFADTVLIARKGLVVNI